MYTFRFTTLINTNSTSNYQSTNETHYTQQNTAITTHKGLQLLLLTETRYQLQPSDKELLTEHTPLTYLLTYYPCSRLKHATRIPHQPSHTETPTHIETRTHDRCGDTIEKLQAPDDGCINDRNMLSIEEVK